MNEKGQLEAHSQPIYGCRFDEQDFLDLLKRYLSRLDIKNAKSIQIIAHRAPWIWLNVKDILMEFGVEDDKIVETLDHSHAVGYVHDLVKAMPKEVIELIELAEDKKDALMLFNASFLFFIIIKKGRKYAFVLSASHQFIVLTNQIKSLL